MNVKTVASRLVGVLGIGGGMVVVILIGLTRLQIGFAESTSPPLKPLSGLGETLVSSDIAADTTWTQAGSPYIIPNLKVTVLNGAVLTIQPGVTVYFSGTNANLDIKLGARLVAIGSASQPITFTSYFTSAPAPGDWIGINIREDALTSTIQHAVIEYASYGIQIGNSDDISQVPKDVLSSTIRYIANEAIGESPDYSTIACNTIYGCGYGIDIEQSGSNDILSNTIYDITHDGIRLGSGAVRNRSNEIRGNTIRTCGGHGIYALGDYVSMLANTVHHCQGAGIYMPELGGDDVGAHNQIQGNVIYDNGGQGIYAAHQEFLVVRANTVHDNATAAGAAAMHILSSQADLEIADNWLYGNGGNPGYAATLYVESPQPNIDRVNIVRNVLCDPYGDGIAYSSAHVNGSFTIRENAICADTCYAGRFGFVNNSLVRNLDIEGNWWGTNSPTSSHFSGSVDFAPWIVFTITEVTAPPHPADGVTPVMVAIRMRDGSGHTVPGVARIITIETSGGSFVGGGTLVNVTLDDSGAGSVALVAPSVPGTIVLTATEYCGASIPLALDFESTDVVITKVGGGFDVPPGQTITYTISYSNVTDVPASNTWITDTLPENTSYVADSSHLPVHTSANQVWWSVGDLAPHAGGTFVLTLTVGLGNCGGVIANTATITTATHDEQTNNNVSMSQPVTVTCADLITVSKEANATTAAAGGTLTYTIHYTIASVPMTNVRIVDMLPISMTWGHDTAVGLGFTRIQTTPEVVWTAPTLPVGSGHFQMAVDIMTDTCDTTLTNTLRATSDEGGAFTFTLPISVVCEVDLRIQKEDHLSDTCALPGQIVTYTISVYNTGGDDAHNVVVTEMLPDHTSFVGGRCEHGPCVGETWHRVGTTNEYVLAIGTIRAFWQDNAGIEFAIRVADPVPAGVTETVNVVCTSADEAESNLHNNCVSEVLPICGLDMQVSKVARYEGGCLSPGDLIRYTITYTNGGSAGMPGVVLSETLPLYTTYAGSGWTAAGNGVYTHALGIVPAGITGTVSFDVLVANADAIPNTVTVITNVVSISHGNTFTLTTDLPLAPDLVVVKNDNVSIASAAFVELYETLRGNMYAQQVSAAQVGPIRPGDVISYSIAYLNVGRVPAGNVVLTETLPLYTSYAGYGWTDSGDGRHYTLSIGTLAPGRGDIARFYVHVDDVLPWGVEWITNSVEISVGEGECDTDDNISTEETPIDTGPSPTHRIFLPLVMHNHPAPDPDPLRIPVGAHPKSLVISEAHNRVYVTLFDDDGNGHPGGNGRLVVLNLATQRVVSRVPTGGLHPLGIAMLGNRLYVANRDSDNVSVMDANSLAVLQTIPVGHLPFGVAAAGNRVYVTNFDDGTLSIIDASTNTVINTVVVGLHPALPAAWGRCAYVPNHSGREGVTVVCNDGADVYRLRQEWGYFAAAVDPTHNLVYFSRREVNEALYEISATPPYDANKPVLKKTMHGEPPFAIAYNPTTNHILVVCATENELHIIWPGGYATGNVWTLPRQNEGPGWHGGQGIDASGHEVWVANYADGSVSVLYDPP